MWETMVTRKTTQKDRGTIQIVANDMADPETTTQKGTMINTRGVIEIKAIEKLKIFYGIG